MSQIKWIKLNVNMFDDEKIRIIQKLPKGDTLLLIWIKLICLAGKTNEGGYIYMSEDVPYTEKMLSILFNKPITVVKQALDTFKQFHMIEEDDNGIYLVNFEKHQNLDKMETIKEQTRLRVAKYRERMKEKKDVTLQVTQCNAIDKDIDINKKKYIKKSVTISPQWLNEDIKKENMTEEELKELEVLYKEFK